MPTNPGRPERIPGLGALFQMDNYSWRPLTLGVSDGWPPPPPEDGSAPPVQREAGGSDNPSASTADGTADDHDPRPPHQDPEDGPL